MRPETSIIIPMRNSEKYILATLRSILLEERVFFEVIVVDDQSSDSSAQLVMSLNDDRVRLVMGSATGISDALNIGIAEARGDVIMRCDADDLYPQGRVYRQTIWMRENLSYGALCGGFSSMDQAGRLAIKLPTGYHAEDITKELMRGDTRTHLCTYAIRRSVINNVGLFRSYFVTAEDVDFQLRLSRMTNVMYLPEIFYHYRLHDESITHSQGDNQRKFFENTARLFHAQFLEDGADDLDRGKPPIPPESLFDSPGEAKHQIAGMIMGEAWREHTNGNKLQAIKIGVKSLAYLPGSLNQWKNFIALIVK